MSLHPLRFVRGDAAQQTYFGFRIVINDSVPAKTVWTVYPTHPASYCGRENGLTEMHMSAVTNELVQESPNRKDVRMVIAPGPSAAAA